jgi:SAM-dependent methyltransferase
VKAVLYDSIGRKYRNYRHPDLRIGDEISKWLPDEGPIINIGAGAGSYEPVDRKVVAVEPSSVMIDQRPRNSTPVIQACAEALPLKDNSFECAMAILTIHHWSDMERGLKEAVRVSGGKVVLLTWIGFVNHFWLLDYLPEMKVVDESMFPSIDQLYAWLGPVQTIPIPIPYDCTDGFLCAYWQRPEAYLNEDVRSAISAFSRVQNISEGIARLKDDLESGLWEERYGYLFQEKEIDFGYRLVAATGTEDNSLTIIY